MKLYYSLTSKIESPLNLEELSRNIEKYTTTSKHRCQYQAPNRLHPAELLE